VQAGDLIVSGTDGLFDNLFNYEILSVLQKEAHKMDASNLA